jgi:hypothetical protein
MSIYLSGQSFSKQAFLVSMDFVIFLFFVEVVSGRYLIYVESDHKPFYKLYYIWICMHEEVTRTS